MTDWTPDRVRDEAGTWVWVPPDGSEARTPEYHLVVYPPALAVPTQVAWCRSQRTAPDVVDEVVALARAWRSPDLSFWVGDRTTPADLGAHLRARGAEHVESVEVLSMPLAGPALRAAGLEAVARDGALVCAGVEVRPVVDAATLHDADLVSVEVWGGERPEEDVADRLQRFTGDAATETVVVAYLDGEPAATAGLSLAGEVARLWGGSTREAYRGRGAYRATLAARLHLARHRGATLGLVKAVTTTSAPVLRRRGFTGHGVEDRLRLDLTALAPGAAEQSPLGRHG